MTLKDVVFAYMDKQRAGDFSGWLLFEAIKNRTGRNRYPETILHYVREYASRSGAEFSCIDKARSLYHYRPGIKLGRRSVA